MNVLAFPELNEITKLNESIVEKEDLNIFYRLYEIVIASERRYVVYIKTVTETEFEIVADNINYALDFYNLIVSNEVLPCTLYDIVQDRRQDIRLNC